MFSRQFSQSRRRRRRLLVTPKHRPRREGGRDRWTEGRSGEERKPRLQTDQRRSSSFGNGNGGRNGWAGGRGRGLARTVVAQAVTAGRRRRSLCLNGEAEGEEEDAQCQCNRVFPYTAPPRLLQARATGCPLPLARSLGIVGMERGEREGERQKL